MSEDLISSLYPPPPVFYKYFTEENVNKLKEVEDPETVEGHLKFLVPPKQPEGKHYTGYGSLWSFEDKLPQLKEMGISQLYPDTAVDENSEDKIKELHKLIKSLLVNFVELLGIMNIQPLEFHTKVEDMKVILININHLLNSYRPHQSRELLIMLLRKRINDKNNEITTIDDKMNDIRAKLSELSNYDKLQAVENNNVSNSEGKDDIKQEIINKLLSNI